MAKSKQTVAIKVNQNKLMANLKFSFSNKHTILGEILQNARRAGATFVKLNTVVDSNELVIVDNGKGISDFQNLFSVAESGWDVETLQKEKPFGMGWLSCLYGSDNIYVESNNHFISGNSQEIIGGAGIEVYETDVKSHKDDTYTKIVLGGFTLTEKELTDALNKLSAGFAIDVYLNNKLLDRKENVEHLKSIPDYYHQVVSDVGIVFIPVRQECINRYQLYLQGLPVNHDGSHHLFYETRNIIHLDSEKIFARMPDRDKLIDEADVITAIRKAVHGFHLEQLLKLKASLTPEQFATHANTSYAMSIDGGFDTALTAKDVRFSDHFFGQVSNDQPSCNYELSKIADNRTNEISVSYNEMKNGDAVICTVEDMEEYEGWNGVAFIFARKLGWNLLNEQATTKGWHDAIDFNFSKHWVNEFVFALPVEEIGITINQETKREQYSFACWQSNCEIVLCESYTLTYKHPDGEVFEVVITDEPLLTADGDLLIPNSCSSHTAAVGSVEQGHGYYWEDEFHDEERDQDSNAFALYLELMRSGDECAAISGHINNNVNFHDYSQFKGVEFKLVIGERGEVVISKLEAEALPA